MLRAAYRPHGLPPALLPTALLALGSLAAGVPPAAGTGSGC